MKKFVLFIFAFCVCFTITSAPIIPDPHPEVYEKIELLPFNGHGWYPHAKSMKKLIQKHNVKTVIEVGSWLGCSTRHIASVLPPDGKVYAVDHWLGSEEINKQERFSPMLSKLYEQFLSNVIHAGLTDKIIPVRLPSLIAADRLKNLDLHVDLLFIDGSHDYESVYADISAWFPYIQGHGVICGDDFCLQEVREAVTEFADENGLTLEFDRPVKRKFWILRE